MDKYDFVEGGPCLDAECAGRLRASPGQDCDCYLSAPCDFHTDPRLECPECGWEGNLSDVFPAPVAAQQTACEPAQPVPTPPKPPPVEETPAPTAGQMISRYGPKGGKRIEVGTRYGDILRTSFWSHSDGDAECEAAERVRDMEAAHAAAEAAGEPVCSICEVGWLVDRCEPFPATRLHVDRYGGFSYRSTDCDDSGAAAPPKSAVEAVLDPWFGR